MSEEIFVKIPSNYKFLNLVDKITCELADEHGLGQKLIDEVAISVIEACTNAIEHGNKCCPEETVEIVYRLMDDRFSVEVYDHGNGFDYKSYFEHIPDPKDIHHSRGRGLYIMRQMMDALEFEMVSGRGMKVTLQKLKDV